MSNKRLPTDGVALSAIVAKETTTGKWSGSGGGLGLGTGGVGLFVGGVSGTKHEQTKRAEEFDSLPEEKFNWLYVYAPLLAMIGIGMLVSCGSQLSEFLTDTSSQPASTTNVMTNISANLSNMVSWIGKVVPPVLFVGCVIWYFFGFKTRQKEETLRYENANKKREHEVQIYNRLRYVEVDHIVFDPLTGEETTATRENILKLISAVSQKTK
ncbi:hypothetical protein M988_4393 [Hafnia paralvei ATCC 29927]|uniref:hypothetical protein n=1 Tax=Hafnia paralvei TaxID=546367 RepID=UPI0007E3E9B1|nr:hypothetical protein [Hafnia paralvei]OAT35696.1 hypothetical protein M988_4393 [Hafnia paralvei ATCC 29927]